MKKIFETFKDSIYNPSFYQSATKDTFWNIFRYYSNATLILSLIMTVTLGIVLVPRGVAFVKEQAVDMVKTYYPADLVIHIENGEATANVPMPYVIPVKQITGVAPSENNLQNMIVVDTNREFDKKMFQEHRTYVLLTKTEIVTQNDNGQITIQELRGSPITTLNQEVLLSLIEKVRNSIPIIVTLGLFATFIILAIGYLVYLIPLLIFALVPFFIAWLRKSSLSYVEAYKISLYAIIPALALKTLLNLMGVFFLPSYFTLLVFMLIVAVNMREVEEPTLFENK